MDRQLFEGERIRLVAPDPDRDAEIESRWTHNPEYLRLISLDPARPLSPNVVKKRYEAEKDDRNSFRFAILSRADNRLVGFVRLERVNWSNGGGWLSLGIGSPADRGQGYGTEALGLALRYAFAELNLYRLTAITFEYNQRAAHFLERAGFTLEVRRRQVINRDGRRWDVLMYGLLRSEWEARNNPGAGE